MRLRTKFEDDDFKLGEVVVADIVSPFTKDELKICCRARAGGLHTFIYHSIAEVLEDWEDYEPVEPIFDEKIRRGIRAWLEANDLDGATFHTSSHFFHYWNLRGFNDNGQGVDIDFFLTGEGIPNLIDGKYYTKTELCGDEV